MERNYPEIIISDEGVTWLDKGQMWMYKNNLEQCDPQIKNGELVDIVTNKGRYLGTGFISLKSHITVRILSKDRKEIIDREFFKKRIQQAYDFRKTVEGDNLSNCRLIFGEADFLQLKNSIDPNSWFGISGIHKERAEVEKAYRECIYAINNRILINENLFF